MNNHLDQSRMWTDQDKQVADSMSFLLGQLHEDRRSERQGHGRNWAAWDEKTKQPMIFGNPPEGPQAPSDAAMTFFQSYFDKLYAK